ncbi:hypothetical protein Lal_00041772, partial [Lupinus albus]
IQKRDTLRMISATSITSDIYVIKTPNLWNYRLAQASHVCMDVVKMNFPFVSSNKSHLCDICHLAKQKKLSFR